jgi:hypothetical protein
MTIITIKIPDDKASDVSMFVKNIGGEVILNNEQTDDENNEVTHESYFGENIKRVIKAFKK